MKDKPFASALGSLMYAQVCTRPHTSFIRTKEYMLVYRRVDNLEIVEHTDLDLNRFPNDKKLTSGYVFMMARGAISWKKFIACFAASTHVVWLRNFMVGLCIVESIVRPLRIFCDNNVATFYTKNNKTYSGSKHFELRYMIIRDLVKDGSIVVEHVDTDSKLIDSLIEGLRLLLSIEKLRIDKENDGM
ncbi:hypothetical protein CR513_61541, partial [Mucuna pruriens]